MHVRPEISLYVTHSMLYRYCSIAFIIPTHEEWGLYPLLTTGSPGHLLRDGRETPVRPGNYIVLRQQGKSGFYQQYYILTKHSSIESTRQKPHPGSAQS